MSEKFITTICRLCTRKGLYDMFEHRLEINEDNLVLISEAYQMFSSLKIDKQSLIAPMLCAYCTEELGQAYNFYQKVKLLESYSLNEGNNDDDTIDEDFIEMDDSHSQVEELNKDQDEDYIEFIVNENTLDGTEEKDLVIYNEDEIVNETNKKHTIEVLDHMVISEPNTRKFNKIPNIQLTSKVSTLLNRITKSGTLLQKRKSSTTDAENSSVPNKVQKIGDNFIMAPKFVLYETRYADKITDSLTDEHNRISEMPEGSIFPSAPSESNDIKQNLNKRKMPALPTHKVTMDISAVRLETNSTQLDIYSNLDKKEDASVLYQCSYCPKAFATQYHLGLHTQKVHVCQHCLTGFTKIQDLYAHVKAEHNTFICSFCNKQMSTNSNLRAHVRKIHGVALPAGVSLISLQK